MSPWVSPQRFRANSLQRCCICVNGKRGFQDIAICLGVMEWWDLYSSLPGTGSWQSDQGHQKSHWPWQAVHLNHYSVCFLGKSWIYTIFILVSGDDFYPYNTCNIFPWHQATFRTTRRATNTLVQPCKSALPGILRFECLYLLCTVRMMDWKFRPYIPRKYPREMQLEVAKHLKCMIYHLFSLETCKMRLLPWSAVLCWNTCLSVPTASMCLFIAFRCSSLSCKCFGTSVTGLFWARSLGTSLKRASTDCATDSAKIGADIAYHWSDLIREKTEKHTPRNEYINTPDAHTDNLTPNIHTQHRQQTKWRGKAKCRGTK